MHAQRSLLLSSLLALLALTPSIAATPTPQSSGDVADPIPTPDFSNCVFATVIDTTIETEFILTLLSDTLPLRRWPVHLNEPSAKTIESVSINPNEPGQPLWTLTDGFLNTTGLDQRSYPGRFVPSTTLKPLQKLVFGGQGEPSKFFAKQSCDATGTPYTELRAGQGEYFFFSFFPVLGGGLL